jgi:integrase
MCGLRQGEALALRWQDIDFDRRTLRVSRQLQRMRRDGKNSGRLVFSEPKNASRRTVGLPQRAVSTLKSHRKRQLEEKLKVADYEDPGLVFASSKGTPIDAQNVVNRYYKPVLKRAGLPRIRFHDLRHSCLSLLHEPSTTYCVRDFTGGGMRPFRPGIRIFGPLLSLHSW